MRTALLLWLLRRPLQWLRIALVLLLVGVVGLAAWLLGSMVYGFHHSAWDQGYLEGHPARFFQELTGRPVPAGARDLQLTGGVSTGGGDVFIRFRAPAPTISDFLADSHARPAQPEDLGTWLVPPRGAYPSADRMGFQDVASGGMQLYVFDRTDPPAGWEGVIAVDRSRGLVYLRLFWI